MKLRHLIPILLLALCILAAPAAAAGGAGTASNPYIIQSPAELQSIQNDLSAYYVLGNNVDMSGYSFVPIGSTSAPFFGTLDGRGYTISNLNVNAPSTNNIGMFGVISGATIRDLNLDSFTISGKSYVGGLVGVCKSTAASLTSILNVNISNSVINSADTCCGGIGGMMNANGVISYCDVSHCDLSSESYHLGGVFGVACQYVKVDMSHCTSRNNIITSSSYRVGGICGAGVFNGGTLNLTDCEVLDCYIYSTDYNVGGIAGMSNLVSGIGNYNNNRVVNCVIIGGNTVGGIASTGGSGATTKVMMKNNIIDNCVLRAGANCGGIIAMGMASAGGICTLTDNDVINSSIYSSLYSGGIAGSCYEAGTTTISGSTVSNTTVQANNYAAGICPTFSRA